MHGGQQPHHPGQPGWTIYRYGPAVGRHALWLRILAATARAPDARTTQDTAADPASARAALIDRRVGVAVVMISGTAMNMGNRRRGEALAAKADVNETSWQCRRPLPMRTVLIAAAGQRPSCTPTLRGKPFGVYWATREVLNHTRKVFRRRLSRPSPLVTDATRHG